MLQLKIRPGDRIAIGDGVLLAVVLDENRKMALRISAPTDHRIERVTPDAADLPHNTGPQP